MSQPWMQLKSITLNADTELPEPWPDDASAEYVMARRALLEAEKGLRNRIHAVAEMRRALPPGAVVGPYEFTEGARDLESHEPVRRVTLVDLFGHHDVLVVYHLMFHPDDDEACPMCSMWVDGLHGVSHHIGRRAAFVVVAKAPLKKLRPWARRRGWYGLRLVSSFESSFNRDLHVEGARGGQLPAVSVFARHGDEVRHMITQLAEFPGGVTGGIDLLSPVWNAFDLTPDGRDDWYPDNTYPGRDRS